MPGRTPRNRGRTVGDRRKAKPPLLKLPGLVAISIYMVLLAGTMVAFVMNRHLGLLYLIFPVLFIAGALGLLMLLRWAWALTLAAVALSSASFLFEFFVDSIRFRPSCRACSIWSFSSTSCVVMCGRI